MMKFNRVVCGLDGSAEGLEAARQGRALLGEEGMLLGVAVWDPSPATHARLQAGHYINELRNDAVAALEEAQREIPGIETRLLRSREVAGLLAAAARYDADVIAVGMHGRSRAFGTALGSVATGIVHYAPCSVLVARAASSALPGPILHPTDGSDNAMEAARAATLLSERIDAPMTILEVGEGEAAGRAAAQALELNPDAESQVTGGSPSKEIVKVAEQTGSRLIVIGSRGLTGLRSLGSVSERVAHSAPCSVLIVRDTAHADPNTTSEADA